jgi:hypothetical protein
MRILAAALICALSASAATAAPLCGVFKAVAYAPEPEGGRVVHVNPRAVTSLKLTLSGEALVPKDLLGAYLEIEFRSKSACYADCPAELVRVVRRLPPFGPKPYFHRGEADLVKAEPCVPTPEQAIGLD